MMLRWGKRKRQKAHAYTTEGYSLCRRTHVNRLMAERFVYGATDDIDGIVVALGGATRHYCIRCAQLASKLKRQ